MYRVIFDEEENKYQLNKLIDEDTDIKEMVTEIKKLAINNSMSYLKAKKALDYANQVLLKKTMDTTY
ncbi:hypothetical protein [Lactobacillus sp. LL6]|uniref:hypothetical protein n=1 Tax=Lactobacillus sp. LL6 TaxID=2596827 RepID=UPI001184E88C|nr:hypothetical protein [Lactobacillus sp. LL6]TSO25321.1 hypothetical protein FOD82_08775 [Lactobacillus sp. LL6]